MQNQEKVTVCTIKHSSIFQIGLSGRQFYGCALPQGSGCKFFLWADQADQGGGTGGFGNSFTDTGGGGTNSGNSTLFSSQSNR